MAADLRGCVAVVTGSTRGVGRGIALALGEAGATVYVTGRSSGSATTEGLPGTVESVAEEVSARGGVGIGVRCDFRDDAQIAALFEQVGVCDVLVNNVWGGYENAPAGLAEHAFWNDGMEYWDRMFVCGLRAHIACSRLAAPQMVERGRGLIVNTIAWAEGKYLMDLFYDVAKHSIARLSYGMALELRKHAVACVALAPGFVRSERVMAAHAAQPFDLSGTESPEYIGRAVAALALDSDVMRWSGQVLTAGALAEVYGFTDVDGRRVPPFSFPAGFGLD